MPITVKAEITQRKAEGNFFRVDPAKTMMQNALDAVEWLAEEGAKQLRANLSSTKGTGFTAGHIEGFTYKRSSPNNKHQVQSKFGKTRLEQGLERAVTAGTSSQYGPKRRPYITMRVLETGHYGGSRSGPSITVSGSGRLRKRSSGWVAGAKQNRQAHWAVKKTYQRMRAYERAIKFDITKGLN